MAEHTSTSQCLLMLLKKNNDSIHPEYTSNVAYLWCRHRHCWTTCRVHLGQLHSWWVTALKTQFMNQPIHYITSVLYFLAAWTRGWLCSSQRWTEACALTTLDWVIAKVATCTTNLNHLNGQPINKTQRGIPPLPEQIPWGTYNCDKNTCTSAHITDLKIASVPKLLPHEVARYLLHVQIRHQEKSRTQQEPRRTFLRRHSNPERWRFQ